MRALGDYGNSLSHSAWSKVAHLPPRRDAALAYRTKGPAAEAPWIHTVEICRYRSKASGFARLHAQNHRQSSPQDWIPSDCKLSQK